MIHQHYIQENLDWIKSGKIGCTFAAYFARQPESIGWKFLINPPAFYIPGGCLLLSIIFPNSNKDIVKQWALTNDFYLEPIAPGLTGLRRQFPNSVSWVQYFGLDSPVATRQTPHPMLTLCVKAAPLTYAKVGLKGILHIAHASITGLSKNVADRLWDSSHSNTQRQLGHKPTVSEAAKTTFHD